MPSNISLQTEKFLKMAFENTAIEYHSDNILKFFNCFFFGLSGSPFFLSAGLQFYFVASQVI